MINEWELHISAWKMPLLFLTVYWHSDQSLRPISSPTSSTMAITATTLCWLLLHARHCTWSCSPFWKSLQQSLKVDTVALLWRGEKQFWAVKWLTVGRPDSTVHTLSALELRSMKQVLTAPPLPPPTKCHQLDKYYHLGSVVTNLAVDYLQFILFSSFAL